MRKRLQPELVTCDICGLSYVANIAADRRFHETHHRRILESYDKTIEQYCQQQPLTWFRPKVENYGVYQALNELNPRLLGFSCTGLREADWQAIQQDESLLPIGRGDGDGHDRYGQWLSPDGRLYDYHANWRCGRIHFTEKERGSI